MSDTLAFLLQYGYVILYACVLAEQVGLPVPPVPVLLGMGGSSLAPDVFMRTFGAADGALELIVLDTTHPATIERVVGQLELGTTLFIVASKSGGTTETLSHLAFFWDKVPNGTQFVAITDRGTSLETLARERGQREQQSGGAHAAQYIPK